MKKKNNVFAQTFIVPTGADELSIRYHIYMMFLSYLSIRNVHPDEPFYLITNQESLPYVKDFPYTEILVSLDSYGKPMKPSFSKLHSIDILKGENMVHFDNDVFVFKPIPDFKDTIAQSLESNFMEFFWSCKLRHQKWIFPSYAEAITGNYNPGVFGFKSNSIVRDEYYETCVFYHDENSRMLSEMPDCLEKAIMKNNSQDIFAMIEEGFLFHFVKEMKADIALVVPDKYPIGNAWGNRENGFCDFDSDYLDRSHYHADYCKDYVHLMGWSTKRFDYVQPIIDRVYNNNKGVINEYFGIEV